MYKMPRKAKRRCLLVCCLAIAVFAFYFLHDIYYCDFEEQSKLVKMPSGKLIPYFSGSEHLKTYGELVSVSKRKKAITRTVEGNSGQSYGKNNEGFCDYNDKEGIVQCPDVRFKGESFNRQGLLVIARMHAVFDDICKRHNITYFVFAGQLLGSQRNGRMIPWDYDSDVGLLIEDFLVLLKHIRKELPPDIYFEDGVDDPSFTKFCEARLRDRNTCYGHCLRTGCKRHDGLQIDIFAFRRVEKAPLIGHNIKNANRGKVSSGSVKIKNIYYNKELNYDDVYPTGTIRLEGLTLPAPRDILAVNNQMYGPGHLKLPDKSRYQCPNNGYTGIPWYSCQEIANMSVKERHELLSMSMAHRNYFFWLFG